VVADRADQAVVVARHAIEGAAQHAIGLALPVGVGGKDGVDPLPRPQQRRQAVLGDRLAEVEEPAPTPGADRAAAGLHREALAQASPSPCGGESSPCGPCSPSPLSAPTPTFSGSGFSGALRFGFFGAMISRLSGLSSSSPAGSRATITVEPGVIS